MPGYPCILSEWGGSGDEEMWPASRGRGIEAFLTCVNSLRERESN